MIPPLPTFIPRKPIRYRARAAQPQQPTPPPAAAVVVSAVESEDGLNVTLTFDRPLTLVGPPPWAQTDAIAFNDVIPAGASHPSGGANVLVFDMLDPLAPNSGWNVNAQPAWISTPLLVPQAGNCS